MNLPDMLLDLLFPPKCPFCGRILDRPEVCPACLADLPRNKDAAVLRPLPGDLLCAAPLRYEGMARAGLLRFKFQGASGYAGALGALLADCLLTQFSGTFDTVTWVPVSRKRLRKRGYDQAELLARAVCRRWGTRPMRLLWKTADNPAQSGLPGDKRRENVRNVYRAAKPSKIREKRILLIDDICTTGSTLSECARVLLEAGAETVACGALAHAGIKKKTEKAGEFHK